MRWRTLLSRWSANSVALVLIPLLSALALTSWALASPVGASPDDDFHLASIWCAAGDRDGLCESTGDSTERVVPADLIDAAICYAHEPQTDASCQGEGFGTHPQRVATTDRGNFSGLYPPVFYFAMSAFAGPNVEVSVTLMRVANAILFVGLALALFLLLPASRRVTLVAALVVTVVPLGMFLIPSTNPSAWAIISAGALWLALRGFFESTGPRRIGLGAVAAVATVMGAGARADSAVYAGIAIVVALLLGATPTRAFARNLILPAVLLVVALVLYFSSRQSSVPADGLTDDGFGGILPEGGLSLVISNFINIPDLWAGAFGSWPLGWRDTPLPAAVWFFSLAVFCGVVFLGLRHSARGKGLAIGILFASVWLIPTVVLQQTQTLVGDYVQPRYVLPLIIMIAGVALWNAGALDLSRMQIGVITCALALANSLALHSNIRRYTVGLGEGSWNLDSGAKWWWHLPVSPMFVWSVGSLAFTGALLALGLILIRTDRLGSVSSVRSIP